MADAEVVVVALGLDPGRLATCTEMLDPAETARANRFLRAADRDRFIASHAALRAVLGTALGLPAADLRFRQEPGGRPCLKHPSGTGLDFNLSHSGGLALVGLTRGARIGVDVEARRVLPDAQRIARSHFAPDEAMALDTLAPQAREAAFLALWTRKEAVVKAIGAGLSLPLAAFSVTVPPAPPRMLRIAGDAAAWTLSAIDAGPGAFATAAVTTADCALRVSAAPEDWADKFAGK